MYIRLYHTISFVNLIYIIIINVGLSCVKGGAQYLSYQPHHAGDAGDVVEPWWIMVDCRVGY